MKSIQLKKLEGEAGEERRELPKVNMRVLVVAVALMVTVGLSGFFFFKWQIAKRAVGDPEVALEQAQREIDQVVAKVGKLILLPDGETPNLVKIDDKEKISENLEFFKDSSNGDQVLIYREAQKAYLYRPSENWLINVGSVTFEESSDGEIQAEVLEGGKATEIGEVAGVQRDEDEVTTEYSFAVRNGAAIGGLAGTYSLLIEEKIAGAKVLETGNAQENEYQESFLVSFVEDGGQAELVAQILGLELASLPASEATPETDFLVVVGRDQGEKN